MLDRGQRDVLRAEAVEQLQNVGVIAEVMVAERWEDARRMCDFTAGLAGLLDDLGWPQESGREEFRLTMPVGRLVLVVNRMQLGTARKLDHTLGLLLSSETICEQAARCAAALSVYNVVLGAIARGTEAAAAADPEGTMRVRERLADARARGVAERADEIVRRELGAAPIVTDPIERPELPGAEGADRDA